LQKYNAVKCDSGRAGSRWGSLQCSPDSIAGFKGGRFANVGGGRKKAKRREEEREGRKGAGEKRRVGKLEQGHRLAKACHGVADVEQWSSSYCHIIPCHLIQR